MKEYGKKEKLHIFLSSFINLEYGAKEKLIRVFGEENFAKSFYERKSQVINIIGEELYGDMVRKLNSQYINSVIEELNGKGITAVTVCSEEYPEKLHSLDKKPFVLYAKGNLSLLKAKSVAIVGSRVSIPLSLSIAKDYSETLAKAGITVVTGIADGADEQVIRAALPYKKIISVTAGGPDTVNPVKNQKLFDEVAKEGLALSEYLPGVAAQKFNFPLRNRIIAGISDATVVVSGKCSSGTKYTAGYAKEYGRKVFAPPYSIGISCGEICNKLIKDGAELTTSPEDILSFFGVECEKIETAEENNLLEFIGREPVTAEKISETLGITIGELLPQLSMLELQGLIVRGSGNTYGRTGKNRRN